ncbi:CDP-glycerol glycerophosphotransferase family protein [Enterococcus casseliflavus]|uniref:CDP-glycerol glycerophosphotransferase family protein n=1 Tax=Enterococcus casseliflavus TaxID=37734 RepID=UPI0022E80EEB|nr:CDP-glycerol glycerophosphotransferase family protein [Enterococcus casseliflavus]
MNHDLRIYYLYSFTETSDYVLDKLIEAFPNEIVIIYTKPTKKKISRFENKNCSLVRLNSLSFFKKNIPAHIKNSKLILCDNYFAFLGSISFSEQTKIVQLWHANGAIKKFGLEAEYAKKTLSINKTRYQSVYNKFTHFVLSSEKMATIFSKSFNIEFTSLFFGYPKTDIYFDKCLREKTKILGKQIKKNKRLLLYVPTYREDKASFEFNLDEILKELDDEWLIFVHLHPHDTKFNEKFANYSGQIMFSTWKLSELLFITDCLVTDYSSVPFEYTLANPNGKVIYYCYDFDTYNKKVGIQADFLEWAKEDVVYSQEELINLIKTATFKSSSTKINSLWNEHAKGNSVKLLKDWIEAQHGN